MAGKERGGPRINYRRTRGSFVLPTMPVPAEMVQYDDNGRVIRPIAGGSGVELMDKLVKKQGLSENRK